MIVIVVCFETSPLSIKSSLSCFVLSTGLASMYKYLLFLLSSFYILPQHSTKSCPRSPHGGRAFSKTLPMRWHDLRATPRPQKSSAIVPEVSLSPFFNFSLYIFPFPFYHNTLERTGWPPRSCCRKIDMLNRHAWETLYQNTRAGYLWRFFFSGAKFM
jgi:hypothetical protein